MEQHILSKYINSIFQHIEIVTCFSFSSLNNTKDGIRKWNHDIDDILNLCGTCFESKHLFSAAHILPNFVTDLNTSFANPINSSFEDPRDKTIQYRL